MAISNDSPPAPAVSAKQSSVHPFAALSESEILNAVRLVRGRWPQETDIHFKTITLQEPPKAEMLPILEAENKGETWSPLSRKAFALYYLRGTDKLHEAVIDLSAQKIDTHTKLGPNLHAPFDAEVIFRMEKVALNNEKVQEEIAKLQLPEGSVLVCDPWPYGSDGIQDDDLMAQCFLYLRDTSNSSEADSNHYSLPLPISPLINPHTNELIRIDYLPTGVDNTVNKSPGPWKHRVANEYLQEAHTLRTDIKPLNVVQPEGTSFRVTEQGTSQVIEWQKWSFRVGFNQREGMVLYNVRYDSRPLFYRVSLSDMNIPYADPRYPYHKKSAFDLGDAGAGLMANDLKLGCDCLGSIYYLSSVLSSDTGGTTDYNNCVCVHEQDAGIGWKHTNFRTGRAVLVRNRELVLQSIITVANYEYILAFIFNQAGEMHYEVRATGILSTQPVDDDVDVPFGTLVHPGVLAVHHQHIFSLRVDPMIDGHSNRLIYSEALPMEQDKEWNPHGNGYYVKDTLLTHSGGYESSPFTNRTFKIINDASRNPVNGKPVAYKIMAPTFQPILSAVGSYNWKRAEFADRAIYATAYREDELFAGGKYTNQSRGGTGVRAWAERNDDIVDKDLVVFVQFGINHIPRIEDFPVMPCETMRVMFKPVNFFDKNPSIDVPQSNQEFNKSVLVSEKHRQGTAEARIGEDGEVESVGTCCGNGTNGHTNGDANGHANGNTNDANGHTNGHANGPANGHTNGVNGNH